MASTSKHLHLTKLNEKKPETQLFPRPGLCDCSPIILYRCVFAGHLAGGGMRKHRLGAASRPPGNARKPHCRQNHQPRKKQIIIRPAQPGENAAGGNTGVDSRDDVIAQRNGQQPERHDGAFHAFGRLRVGVLEAGLVD